MQPSGMKHEYIAKIEADERYKNLSYDEKKNFVNWFFDDLTSQSKSYQSADDMGKESIRQNFLQHNLPEPPPKPGALSRLTGRGAPARTKPGAPVNPLSLYRTKDGVERPGLSDVGVITEAAQQLESGVRGVSGSYLAARAMLTPNEEKRAELLGRYDYLNELSQETPPTTAFSDIVQRTDEGKIKPIETAARAQRWAVGTSMQMLPIVGSIMAGGSIGAYALGYTGLGATLGGAARVATSVAGRGLTRVGAAGMGKAVAGASDKTIAAYLGSTMGSFSVGYAMYAGSLYGDITAMGGGHEESRRAALKYGAPAAAVSIVVPMGAQMSVMGYMGKTWTKKRVRDIALKAGLGTVTEGLAEGIAESFVIAGEMDVLGEIYTPEEIRHRIIEAAAAGALMGAGLGLYGGTGRPKGNIDAVYDSFVADVEKTGLGNNPQMIQYLIDNLQAAQGLSVDTQQLLQYLDTRKVDANAPMNRELQRIQNMALEIVKRDDGVNLDRMQQLAPKAEQGTLTADEALEMTIIMANSKPVAPGQMEAQAQPAIPASMQTEAESANQQKWQDAQEARDSVTLGEDAEVGPPTGITSEAVLELQRKISNLEATIPTLTGKTKTNAQKNLEKFKKDLSQLQAREAAFSFEEQTETAPAEEAEAAPATEETPSTFEEAKRQFDQTNKELERLADLTPEEQVAAIDRQSRAQETFDRMEAERKPLEDARKAVDKARAKFQKAKLGEAKEKAKQELLKVTEAHNKLKGEATQKEAGFTFAEPEAPAQAELIAQKVMTGEQLTAQDKQFYSENHDAVWNEVQKMQYGRDMTEKVKKQLSKEFESIVPAVVVLPDETAFPEKVLAKFRENARDPEADPGKIDAFVYGDKVYVNAKNFEGDPQKVRDKIVHESAIHLGLRKTLGDSQMDSLGADIWKTLSRSERAAIASRNNLKESDHARIGEEWLAYRAEQVVYDGKTDTTWAKISDKIRKFLRSLGYNVKHSDIEIAEMVGKGTEGAKQRAAEWAKTQQEVAERLEADEIRNQEMIKRFNRAWQGSYTMMTVNFDLIPDSMRRDLPAIRSKIDQIRNDFENATSTKAAADAISRMESLGKEVNEQASLALPEGSAIALGTDQKALPEADVAGKALWPDLDTVTATEAEVTTETEVSTGRQPRTDAEVNAAIDAFKALEEGQEVNWRDTGFTPEQIEALSQLKGLPTQEKFVETWGDFLDANKKKEGVASPAPEDASAAQADYEMGIFIHNVAAAIKKAGGFNREKAIKEWGKDFVNDINRKWVGIVNNNQKLGLDVVVGDALHDDGGEAWYHYADKMGNIDHGKVFEALLAAKPKYQLEAELWEKVSPEDFKNITRKAKPARQTKKKAKQPDYEVVEEDTAFEVGKEEKSKKRDPMYSINLFSQMERTLTQTGMLPKTSTREGMANAIKKHIGKFKQTELEESGLLEYVKSMKQDMVTAKDVEDYLKMNQIVLEDVVTGERHKVSNLTEEESAEFDSLEYHVQLGELRPGGALEARFDELLKKRDTPITNEMVEEAERRQDWDEVWRLNEALEKQELGTQPTRFTDPKLNLPGGENYREVLVRLPRKRQVMSKEEYAQVYGRPFSGLEAQYEAYVKDQTTIEAQYEAYVKDQTTNEGAYYSQHWPDDTNVLLHLRLNDRTDVDGKRVLFVEEVQSDWHQEGRRKGYRSDAEKARKEYEKLVMEKYRFLSSEEAYKMGSEKATEIAEQYNAKLDKLTKKQQGTIPDAPFKPTQAWPMLGMKKVIQDAVAQGYDRVAWTPGEVQADRYDLSRYLERVSITKTGDNEYALSAFDKGGERVYDAEGLPGEKLSGYVGKELADKAISDTASGQAIQNYSDLDLKVGGKIHRLIYDSILPKEVGKYIKKWGSKVEPARVPTKELELSVDDFASFGFTLRDVAQDLFNTNDVWSLSEEQSAKLNKEYADRVKKAKVDKFTEQVWSFDITPAMKKSVAEGQPMYSMIGPKAKTTTNKSLAHAKVLSQWQGKTREDVWSETGWWQGPDKKWRFEIDDRDVKFTTKLSWAGRANPTGLLGDFVDAKLLFDAYPQLDKARFRMNVGPGKEKAGGYIPEGGVSAEGKRNMPETIWVEASNIEDAKSALLHEMQHAVQQYEGFAEGGDVMSALETIPYERQLELKEIHEAVKDLRSLQEDNFTQKRQDQIDELIKEYNKDGPLGVYGRLRGEVEARLVERRMDMAPEQRKAEPPWVTMENMLRDEGLLGEGQKVEDVLVREPMYAMAHHGTPHKFEAEKGFPHGRFRLDKIGTGEGAQAYGWGVYLAESPKVGEHYVKSYAHRNLYLNGEKIEVQDLQEKLVKEHGEENRDLALKIMFDWQAGYNQADIYNSLAGYLPKERHSVVEEMVSGLEPYYQGKGWSLRHKAGVRAERQMNKKERFAFWDISGRMSWFPESADPIARVKKDLEKTIEVQDEYIRGIKRGEIKGENLAERQAIKEEAQAGLDVIRKYDLVAEFKKEDPSLYTLDVPDAIIPKLLDLDKPLSGQSEFVQKALSDVGFPIDSRTGEEFYTALTRPMSKPGGSDQAASEYLRARGIPGSKYLDQFSRTEGEGSYNYVIWDQKTLDQIALLKRNGEVLDAMRDSQEAAPMYSMAEEAKKYPKKPDVDKILESTDGDLTAIGKAFGEWKAKLKEWAKTAPDMVKFPTNFGAAVVHKSTTPEKNPWRVTTFHRGQDGEMAPSGHSEYKTKFQAIEEAAQDYSMPPDDSIRFSVLDNKEVRSFADGIEKDLGLKPFDVFLTNAGDLKLNLMVVPKEMRKQNIGSRAVERLIDFADEHGRRIVLSPAVKDDAHGTTSRSRLVKFYKNHGFVENKGRNKDFTIREGMYRNPVQDPKFSVSPPPEAPEFKKWFGDWEKSPELSSKVVDDNGKPLQVYSGHANVELYGTQYNPRLGTAGGFYATESPDIASNYAMGKFGVKESYEGGSQYRFQYKNKKWGKKLFQMELAPEQAKKLEQLRNEKDENGDHVWDFADLDSWAKDNAPYDALARRIKARGGTKNSAFALQNIHDFYEAMGYTIAYDLHDAGLSSIERQQKNRFEDLLDELGIKWQSYERLQPGVLPLYLNIRNPLDASQPFPKDLLADLKKAARYKKGARGDEDYTRWTKDYPLKLWVEEIESGGEYWSTQIPKEAIPIFKRHGYDGIKELGMKGANLPRAERQINWIAFDPEQIKSATGNIGSFSPTSPDIRFSVGEQAEVANEQRAAEVKSIAESRKKIATTPPDKAPPRSDLEVAGYSDFTDAEGLVRTDNIRVDPISEALFSMSPEEQGAPLAGNPALRMFESVTDRLRRSGSPVLKDLADRTDKFYDQAELRAGWWRGAIRPHVKKVPLKERKKFREDFESYWAHYDNGRRTQAEQVLKQANPELASLIKTVKDLFHEAGVLNQEKGLMVFDGKIGKWRPIGKIPWGEFWPRTFKTEILKAFHDSAFRRKNPEIWEKMVDDLLAEGHIKKREESLKYLGTYFNLESRNDYFAGIEKARGQKLPESFYDYSFDNLNRYAWKWSNRISQIEQFGQDRGNKNTDYFDKLMNSNLDYNTKKYIDGIKNRVYNIRANDWFTSLTDKLNILATAIQLGNPATATLNLIGGTTLNVQMFGVKNVARAYKDLMTNWEQIQQDGVERGILGKDVMNLLRDVDSDLSAMYGGASSMTEVLSKFANFTMTWGGYRGTENIIRATAMIASQYQLQDALHHWNHKPNGGQARLYRQIMEKNGLDVGKLLRENGSGEETGKLMRKMVNIPQGSYRIDQTPLYVDTQLGRFFFKYQKFSTQVSRMFWMNHLKPYMEAKTGAERARAFMNFLGYFAKAYVGGSLILASRAALFGFQDPGPELDDMKQAFENNETHRLFGLIQSRAFHSMMAASAFGFFGNYAQFGMDVFDRHRVKNPLEPPGLAPIQAMQELGLRWLEQGRLTARDADDVGMQAFAFYRGYKRLGMTALSSVGGEWKEAGLEARRRERNYARKAVAMFADEMGIERKRTSLGRIGRSPNTPIHREVWEALILGNKEAAREIVRRELQALPPKERKELRTSMMSSIRTRQPLAHKGTVSNEERRAFYIWAQKSLAPHNYNRIREMDLEYRRAAVYAGLMSEVGYIPPER